jgi:hypothetical protein
MADASDRERRKLKRSRQCLLPNEVNEPITGPFLGAT